MVAPVETGAPHGPDRRTFMEWLKKMLEQILHKKKLDEEARKAAEKWQEGQRHETKRERDQAKSKKEEEKEERAYHQAKSSEMEEVQAQIARSTRVQEVIRRLDELQDENKDPEGSRYVMASIRASRDTIDALIQTSPGAAEAVNILISIGTELHGDPRELFKITQIISYEAKKNQRIFNELQPTLNVISMRIKDLLWEELQMKQRLAQRQGRRGPSSYAELLEDDPNIKLSPTEEQSLTPEVEVRTPEQLEQAKTRMDSGVDSIIMNPPTPLSDEQRLAQLGEAIPPTQAIPSAVAAPLDKIWGEMERKEAAGQLSSDDLVSYGNRLWEESSRVYPKDVPAGSEAYNKIANSIYSYVEDKQNELAQRLARRLREERPPIRQGITHVEEFLEEMVKNKGRLGYVFELNPEMFKLFKGLDEKSRKFRDRVFLAIHSAVLTDQRNSSQDNFGLYERADFTTFTDLLRLELKPIVKETGRALGATLSDHYNTLSNAIRQSRDIDYWASQPAANIENFNRSIGLFQNEYVRLATLMPGVNAAFRAYETTLRSIKTANNGFIPASLIEYDAVTKTGFWDNWSREMLKTMIAQGVVPDVERDKFGLEIAADDGFSLKLTDTPLNVEDLSPEELQMYMTLAKGLGVATARYLEIIASSKVPGTAHPEKGINAFHSMPYEGVAKSLNYFNIYVDKWRMGSYKYFYLMNQLIPEGKRISTNPNNSTEAIRAFMAYQDGTFEEKYGTDAKRFVDLTNFSHVSSAIGLNTLWRQYDTTTQWTDRRREWLGGANQLALAGRYASERIKELLVVSKYKEQYRQELLRQNREQGKNYITSGPGFDKLWREYGMGKHGSNIDMEWDKLMGKHPKKGAQHTALSAKTHHLIESYAKAFKARVWIEMAMRNPLVVAHSLKAEVPWVGFEGEAKKMTLHNKLIQEILGIPPEDTFYGEEWGRSANYRTPTKEQREYMLAILTLEGDIAAVREKAINDCRDLQESDFNIIKDAARRNHALEYWKNVRQAVIGETDLSAAEHLYREIGLELLENKEDYAWDFHRIERIDQILNQNISLKNAVGVKQEWILGTDDMAFNKMDILKLGSRQLLRRSGDIASHEAGGTASVDYIVHGIVPNPDKEELAKMLVKVRDAYSGDAIEQGWQVVANLAYMTDRLYAWDWRLSRLGSAAELDVWKTRRNVAAWLANGRRQFWDAIEHVDALPPHAHFYSYDMPSYDLPVGPVDIHTLREKTHSSNLYVWTEIIALGLVLATLITLWRGLTAKSEEEESGGGGH